jgi:hypothetical protein
LRYRLTCLLDGHKQASALSVSILRTNTTLKELIGVKRDRARCKGGTVRGDSQSLTATGGCLCGAVRYEVRGPLRPVINCHCGQCRRTSGHFVAATAAPREGLALVESGGLRWYESSEHARRGFCRTCGASLFWEAVPGENVSIMAGTLDPPTGLRTVAHIFADDAGDYYAFDDGLPRYPQGDHKVQFPDL